MNKQLKWKGRVTEANAVIRFYQETNYNDRSATIAAKTLSNHLRHAYTTYDDVVSSFEAEPHFGTYLKIIELRIEVLRLLCEKLPEHADVIKKGMIDHLLTDKKYLGIQLVETW